nr:GNAT family N-acetyltransferase [Gracilibacillus ureilyticus]
MEVWLKRATDNDAELIFDMQVEAFMPLLNKYEDYDTNPANETIDKVLMRINRRDGGFYKIMADNKLAGAICVFWKEDVKFWISPMFILPAYQGKGIAQKAIKLIEEIFPQASSWELATVLEETKNCYLYEKMGYYETGEKKKINDKTTVVFYKKVL